MKGLTFGDVILVGSKVSVHGSKPWASFEVNLSHEIESHGYSWMWESIIFFCPLTPADSSMTGLTCSPESQNQENLTGRIMRLLVSLVTAVILTGCVAVENGTMLPGRMQVSSSGQVLQFNIEKSTGQGKMTAFNEQTGEKFSGEYSAITVGQRPAAGPPAALRQELIRNANGRGVLVGDKGTTITLYLEIESGNRFTGYGAGVDREGRSYEVSF
jgi:hypothetical protein